MDENGKKQTAILEKITDLDIYKDSKNNFIRAAVENIVEINKSGNTVMIDLIESKDNSHLVFGDGKNEYIRPEDAAPYIGVNEETILWDPEISKVSWTKEAFDVVNQYNEALKKLDPIMDYEDYNAIKKAKEDAISKIENPYTEENSSDEALAHEGDHLKHHKKNPEAFDARTQRSDKYYDNKEEKKTEVGRNSSEKRQRAYHGKGPRQTHSAPGYGTKKKDLKIKTGGQNE